MATCLMEWSLRYSMRLTVRKLFPTPPFPFKIKLSRLFIGLQFARCAVVLQMTDLTAWRFSILLNAFLQRAFAVASSSFAQSRCDESGERFRPLSELKIF